MSNETEFDPTQPPVIFGEGARHLREHVDHIANRTAKHVLSVLQDLGKQGISVVEVYDVEVIHEDRCAVQVNSYAECTCNREFIVRTLEASNVRH